MSARRRIAAAVLAVGAVLGLSLVAGTAPATAVGSQISFVTASPVQTAFGGNWSIQLAARFTDPTTVSIPSSQATVDVYLSGLDAPFATRLPIQPDGSVYVSQSAAATLPPGEYQMTAQLVPVPGSYVDGAVTTAPLILQISAYSVDARISIDDASVAAEEPVIVAELSGQFVETTEAVPAGTWAFTVAAGGTTVVEEEIAQESGNSEPLRYAIPGKLDRGTEYTVSAEFTPIEALAAGLEVTQPRDVTFRTPGGGLGDPIPYPLWLLIITALVPLALAAAVIVLTVQVGRRVAPAGVAADSEDLEPEPGPAEPAWDPFATAGPAEPAPTQVLPREPGAFTQLITPIQPTEPAQPPQHPVSPAQDTPTENWTVSHEDPEDPEGQHLR
ncbi:MAG: hypothetical protein AB7K08_06350 [Microbacteriaceae bacterium]